MDTQELLNRIKPLLQEVYGPQLKKVILYGSEVRGNARTDSDVDVLVLLEKVEDYGKSLRKNIDALYDLSLELGRRISAKPIDINEFEKIDCPLYRHALHEGLVA
ncbi:MAG: hypothetical protein GKR87_14385 [Kiritimatiellae bacterium]|nr:hypothetical protein [Kiritimatiellia bacterium]